MCEGQAGGGGTSGPVPGVVDGVDELEEGDAHLDEEADHRDDDERQEQPAGGGRAGGREGEEGRGGWIGTAWGHVRTT